MDSNVDSDGYAIDHDGERLEFGVPSGTAPFAISGAVFQELFSGSGKDTAQNITHFEAEALGAPSGAKPSSSGGIPLTEHIIVEDYVSSDEEQVSPVAAMDRCKSNTSATIQAMLRVSKHEREELYTSRRRLADALKFLKSKGFQEDDIFKEMEHDGFSTQQPLRDDFGLPLSKNNGDNPLKDKLKAKIAEVNGSENTPKVSTDLPNTNLAGENKKCDGGNSNTTPKPSWSAVVKNSKLEEALTFDYCPMPPRASVVTLPAEALQKGLEKFKCCLVGTFTKGTLPYSKVLELAKKSWDSKGLCQVSQKDSHTFLFKFLSERDMNAVFARGTWYFDRKPLVFSIWGSDFGDKKLTSIPLWVKFKNLPDYYWTMLQAQ